MFLELLKGICIHINRVRVAQGLDHAGNRAVHEFRLVNIRDIARLDKALDTEETHNILHFPRMDAKGKAETGNRQHGRRQCCNDDANDDFFLAHNLYPLLKDRNTG